MSSPPPPMHKLPHLLVLLVISVALGLSGCTRGGYTVAKRDVIERQIETARVETAAKLDGLHKQEVGLLNDTITQHRAREQAAADHLFRGVMVYGGLRLADISRPTMVMGQSIMLTATQLPPATPQAQADTIKALQTELDETKVSTAQLKAQYEAQLAAARADGEAKAQKLVATETALKEVQTAKVSALETAAAKERDLQAAKDKVQDAATAKALQEKADAQHNERLKLWLMGGLGVIALAAGIAAVYVPIPSIKRYGAIMAVAAAGAAIAVPFVQPWHVLVAILCVCVPVGLRIVYVWKQDHGDATDTFRAINELKVKAPEVFKQTVAPILNDWHTDPKTTERIDQKLKDVGDT